jgi:hypothetical protein
MNGQFLQWFALGIAFWATVNYLIDVILSKVEKRRHTKFREKVDRYRR